LFHVATGVEAIETMMKVPDIDLVLMDIKMSKMGGYEAVREIRKFNKEVVIIAQTAYSILGEREKALAAGCNEYISKPINTEILLDIVNNQHKRKCFSSKANNSTQFF
jgi:CheY-like chemotaxis protein